MHTIIRWYLRFLARGILFWKKPVIIGVTGTVGKTTITTVIAQYLRDEVGKDAVQFSPYHYNGEYGFPLTIIGARTG